MTCPRSLLPFLMLGLSPSYPICSIQFRPLSKPHIASGISYPCHSLCSSNSELLAAFSTPCDTATVIETKTTLVLCQSYPPASVILSVGDALSSHFPSLPGSVLHPDQSNLHSILRFTPLITSPQKCSSQNILTFQHAFKKLCQRNRMLPAMDTEKNTLLL